jgi:phage major head subunit gpT-like protein
MTRNEVADLMEVGIRKVFFDEFPLRGEQFRSIYDVTTSRKRQETDVVMAGLGLYQRKAEGNSPSFDNGREAWKKVYTHGTWALGIEITQEAMEDELYGYYQGLGQELGKAARYTQEVEAMDIFNDLSAAVYTANSTDYPLLSTTHYRVDGGTWANRFSVGADLSVDSLEAALSHWRVNMVDQRGRKIRPEPKILLVGVTDRFIAERILTSEKRPFGNDNDPNVLKNAGLRVVVSDFLTDDGRWFLLGEPGQTALTYFQRKPHEMQRHDDGRTGNMLMVGRYRESHGASHVTGVWGSP